MRLSKYSHPAVVSIGSARRRPRRRIYSPVIVFVLLGLLAIAVVPRDLSHWAAARPTQDMVSDPVEARALYNRSFSFCSARPWMTCVIDGDTFMLDGTSIRIADIDAPEIHPARCAREDALGQAAKTRLLVLLNAGPFELGGTDRDRDHYGRKLRIVRRDGASFGEVLVREGLARRWDGRRHPWC